MAGKGDYPLQSAWFLQRRRRRGSTLPAPQLQIGSLSSAQEAVFTDWFFTPASGGAINATFNHTIGAVILSSSADLIISATYSNTIGAVTQSANADLLVQATYGQTIEPVTLSATATVGSAAINATFSHTIDAVTLAASADVIISASTSQTIGPVTQSAAADLLVQASYSQTISDVVLSATATVVSADISATFSYTIEAVGLAAVATISQPASEVFKGGSYGFLNPQRRKRRKEDDDDELEENPALKAIKLGQADKQIITGIIAAHKGQAVTRKAITDYMEQTAMRDRRAAVASTKRHYERLRRDDEWFMMA